VQRALYPTGMWIVVAGGDVNQRKRLAEMLAKRLAPAFRRSRVASQLQLGSSPASMASVIAARMRSTVVVSTTCEPVSPPMHSIVRLASQLSARVLAPDLRINLDRERPDPTFDAEALADEWSETALAWLAARVRKRLRLSNSPSISRSCTAQKNFKPATPD